VIAEHPLCKTSQEVTNPSNGISASLPPKHPQTFGVKASQSFMQTRIENHSTKHKERAREIQDGFIVLRTSFRILKPPSNRLLLTYW
jgi:hypothetical protein